MHDTALAGLKGRLREISSSVFLRQEIGRLLIFGEQPIRLTSKFVIVGES